MSSPTRVHVGAPAPYDVVIGTDVLGELAGMLGTEDRQVLVVHPPALSDVVAGVELDLRAMGHRPTAAVVPPGEAAKTVEVASALWSELGRSAFTRSDAVVSVGGGATSDLAGFVAATWLRGVPVVHVPTTLLGMVDAAVGGKTAIDTADGKNLVGAFHPPAGVVCDLDLLRTLPRDELASGMAEVVKTGFISDPRILELVEAGPAAAMDPTGEVLRELVERSVRVKAGVVAADLRDTGLREILNYGHTLGHAIEKVEHYGWRHGAAVSIGMVYAAELSAAVGRLDASVVARHRAVLGSVGLPTEYARGHWRALLDAMRVDKKARGATLRFVVLDDLARPGVLEGPSDDLLATTYERVSA